MYKSLIDNFVASESNKVLSKSKTKQMKAFTVSTVTSECPAEKEIALRTTAFTQITKNEINDENYVNN